MPSCSLQPFALASAASSITPLSTFAGPYQVQGQLKRGQNTFHFRDGETLGLCVSQSFLPGMLKT